jgi:hypothetical protein
MLTLSHYTTVSCTSQGCWSLDVSVESHIRNDISFCILSLDHLSHLPGSSPFDYFSGISYPNPACHWLFHMVIASNIIASYLATCQVKLKNWLSRPGLSLSHYNTRPTSPTRSPVPEAGLHWGPGKPSPWWAPRGWCPSYRPNRCSAWGGCRCWRWGPWHQPRGTWRRWDYDHQVWSIWCMYIYMYVCMHLCMHACMHAWMYVCKYVCM